MVALGFGETMMSEGRKSAAPRRARLAKLGIIGMVWAVVLASFLSAGLLLARFWMLSRRDV